jgi:hypothetical protein
MHKKQTNNLVTDTVQFSLYCTLLDVAATT